MKNQTAVEYLIEALIKLGYSSLKDWTDIPSVKKLVEQANKMFEQQIIDAREDGIYKRYSISNEQYYNETCGSKGSDEDLIDAINMARNEPDMSGDDIILSIKQSKSTSSQTEINGSKGSDENFKQFSLYEHKETIATADTPTSSQTEISDEEIEKESWRYREVTKDINIPPNEDWSNGAKWYREQLKKK